MINVSDLRFTYPENKESTLKGLDFSIKSGEIFGFLGPSGAEKSTTQKVIIGLLKDYEGQVLVQDKEIKDWDNTYYEQIGVCFEEPNLYHKLTARENLDLIGSLYDKQPESPEDLLKLVGLEDSVDKKVAEFSKGMKMRLNFVRAFIHQPELLFLDEPTAGLDPVNARNIKQIILEKKQAGKTIFLTTHNMTVADELCDRVAFIVDGEIAVIDAPKELKVNKGKRAVKVEYYEDWETKEQEFSLTEIGENEQFIKLLKQKEIKTIHTQEATLEDIFIKVTGSKLS
jgi:fluoroquinolone transport system ATP-binding protein